MQILKRQKKERGEWIIFTEIVRNDTIDDYIGMSGRVVGKVIN